MQSPYLLIPVTLLIITAYLISQVFVRMEILPLKKHRRFWNVVLLITFLISGILGLLLVIQINYRLEWPIINKFLNWHVNFGIAMALTAILHFLWHLDYYLKLFRRSPEQPSLILEESEPPPEKDRKQSLLIIFAGFYAPVVQVLFIRELTTQFQGNEILLTWTLGLWMILTGIGSLLGRRIKTEKINIKTIRNILIWTSISPVIMLAFLYLARELIFPPGILISPWQYLLLILYLLAPICIFTGILFTCFIRSRTYAYTKVYIIESLGSIIGGILVSFLLIRYFTILQSLLLVTFIGLLLLFIHSWRHFYLILCLSALILGIFLPQSALEERLRPLSLGNYRLLENSDGPQGNITVTENGGEYNYFLNGALLFNTGNFVVAEEFVHYAMLQHREPKNILLVSGGVSGMVNEIIKYPNISQIDYVELNEQLLEISQKRNPLPDTAILQIHPTDLLRFLRNTHHLYDVVIMAVPDPSSIQLNRYYSDEFLGMIQAYLHKDAVLIYGLSPSGNYLSNWQIQKLSMIQNTLKKHFREVLIIPGEKDYFIASNRKLSTRIAELSAKYELGNLYVNPYYFDDEDLQRRSRLISEQLNDSHIINTQHKALPVFYSSLRYLSMSKLTFPHLLIPVVLLLLAFFLFPGGIKGMYLAGLTSTTVEIMLIFMVQIAFGYVYSVLGILFSLFMLGLVLGTWIAGRVPTHPKNYRLAFTCMIACLMLFWLFMQTAYIELPDLILWSIFIIFLIIPSALTGFIFVAASELNPRPNRYSAPLVYAADLIGASLGIITMTLILIPLAGLPLSCLILMVLNGIPILSGKKAI